MKNHRMNKILKSFLKEIVPIILGILIALFINNWNENKKNKKYIDHMLSSLNEELNETDKDIQKKIPLQKTLIDTLDFYKNNDKISIFDVMMKVNGVQIPRIRISSWKAISLSKIELVQYDQISTMTEIEELKELLHSKTKYLMNFTYPIIKETGMDKKELLMLMIRDIIATEVDIHEEIKKFRISSKVNSVQ